jgi:hypothetical protein
MLNTAPKYATLARSINQVTNGTLSPDNVTDLFIALSTDPDVLRAFLVRLNADLKAMETCSVVSVDSLA